MPNGKQDSEAVLRAIRQLRERGIESSILNDLEERLGAAAPVQIPEGPGLVLAPGAFGTGLGATRTGLVLGQITEKAIPALLGTLLKTVTGQPVGPIADRIDQLTQLIKNEVAPEGADFAEVKRRFDEVFQTSGIAKVATDAGGEVIGLGVAATLGGIGAARVIGMSSLSLRGLRLEKLGGLITGAVAGGISEPLRITPLPEEARGLALLDVPGQFAQFLKGLGLPEEEALIVGGAAFGGSIGVLFDLFKLYRFNEADNIAKAIDSVKEARRRGIFLEQFGPAERRPVERISSTQVARRMVADMFNQPPEIVLPKEVAKKIAEVQSKERVILAQKNLSVLDRIDDTAFIKALDSGNPEGISVAKGVSGVEAEIGIKALRAEGAELSFRKFKNADGTFDYIIAGKGKNLSNTLAAQYKATGVFDGQAALLKDGTPVRVVRMSETGKTIVLQDPLDPTAKVFRRKVQNVKVLNVDFGPNFERLDDLFLRNMTGPEKEAFRKLAKIVKTRTEGAEGVPRLAELDELAGNTAGVAVRSAAKGEIQLMDLYSGDLIRFDSTDSAIEWIKNYQFVPPELTPTAIRDLDPKLGAAFFGGGGPPLRPGELMPIPDDLYFNTFSRGRGPGFLEKARKPSRGLTIDLEKRLGVPLWTEGFEPLQRAAVRAGNAEWRWVDSGRGIPEGILPLRRIRKLAGGRKANRELITDWLESETDLPRRSLIEKAMKPREIRAAKELRKWYDALGKELDIDPKLWLTDYAPHIRKFSDSYGASTLRKMWRETRPGETLPKELDFFADHYRYGSLNVYEKDAFVAAAGYTRSGFNERIMGTAWKKAGELKRSLPADSPERVILGHYMEALRGREWEALKKSMDNSLGAMLEALPGVSKVEVARAVDQLTLNMLSVSYQATMGLRPGLAIRNLTQTLQTTWTLFGTEPRLFMRALGKALTPAGRRAAMDAGAVAKSVTPVFAGEELLTKQFGIIGRTTKASLTMYKGADEMNRGIAFWMGKLNAEKALRKFAVRAGKATSTKELAKARTTMLRESKVFLFDQPVIEGFLKRLQTDPLDASDFLGKQVADVTQFLYGKGNQPRWMRSLLGRVVGQFGTWPAWYLDFVQRTMRNVGRNAGRTEQAKFLSRLILANGAVITAGATVGIDLTRWAAYNSWFYVGGPGVEFGIGLWNVVRGVSGMQTLGDDRFARRRVAEGRDIIKRVSQTFIPNFYAVRDVTNFIEKFEAGEFKEAGAAALGLRPTEDFLKDKRATAVEIFLEGEQE